MRVNEIHGVHRGMTVPGIDRNTPTIDVHNEHVGRFSMGEGDHHLPPLSGAGNIRPGLEGLENCPQSLTHAPRRQLREMLGDGRDKALRPLVGASLDMLCPRMDGHAYAHPWATVAQKTEATMAPPAESFKASSWSTSTKDGGVWRSPRSHVARAPKSLSLIVVPSW